MNAPAIVLLVATIAAAVWSVWARRMDHFDEYHLAHGPKSGCLDCRDK